MPKKNKNAHKKSEDISADETEPTERNDTTATIQPSHREERDLGIVESHTNYSTETNQSESEQKKSEEPVKIEQPNEASVVENKTAVSEIPLENFEEQKQKALKTQQMSIQTSGTNPQTQVVKFYQETYAPQSHSSHVVECALPSEGDGPLQPVKQQVEIQVGVSLLNQPQKVINEAKQQRVLQDYQKFAKIVDSHKIQTDNQKKVYDSIFEEVQNKKMLGFYSMYYSLREYFVHYANFTKEFYEKSQKVTKQQKIQQANKYLNIGEELKQGFEVLGRFKAETGENYKNMQNFINVNSIKDLDEAYSKYMSEVEAAFSVVKDKKKQYVKLQQQFKKQAFKVQKMFTRTKQGKKEQDDLFAQVSKMVTLFNQSKLALVVWGKQLIQLRKSLVDATQTCTLAVQLLLNNFKNQSNILYGIHPTKFDKVYKSRQQIEADTIFSKLITLIDADYIRASIQLATKKQCTEVTDKIFALFIELPHFSSVIGDPSQLLKNLIVKIFNLKDVNQQLVNTVSGNLVLFNKQTKQTTQIINIKHIKAATPTQQGSIQIQEKVPGIVFNSKKNIKLEFKDGDRAEQLICFLGQGEAN